MKFIKYLICLIIISIILCWGSSYIKCEINTSKYGEIFKDVLNSENDYDTTGKIKVIKYSENSAKIYLVSKKYKYGVELCYKNINGKMKRISDKVIWSQGSADEFIWPYIR